MAVPLNVRFLSDEISMCAELAEARAMVFGEEFADRTALIRNPPDNAISTYIFAGPGEKRPEYARSYHDILRTGDAQDPLRN